MKHQTFILASWVAILLAGFTGLFIYTNTPGKKAEAPAIWPKESQIKRDPGLSTLVLFAHPRCPCSRATIGELERLIPNTKGRIKHIVVFVNPGSKSDKLETEDLWIRSRAIPETETIRDDAGKEANLFGALTSGHSFLYSQDGTLVFEGGITPARGHMGDSDGRAAILEHAATGQKTLVRTHAFGCYLMNPERAADGGVL